MAITWIAGAFASGNNEATVTIPAETLPGDLLVAWAANKNANGLLRKPIGWTFAVEATALMTAALIYKVAVTGDAGSDVLFAQKSSTANQVVTLDVFRGSFDPVQPLEYVPIEHYAAGTTVFEAPSIDASAPGVLLSFAAQEQVAQDLTPAAPLTKLTQAEGSGNTITCASAYQDIPAGATGVREWSMAVGGNAKAAAAVIIERSASIGFPQVKSTGQYDDTTDNTTQTLDTPAGVAPGDLLVALNVTDAAWDVDDPGDFVQLGGNLNITQKLLVRLIDGTEGPTLTYELSGTATSLWLYLVVDASLTTGAIEAANWEVTGDDPPALSPSWGEANTLWIVASDVHELEGFWDGGLRQSDGYLVAAERLSPNSEYLMTLSILALATATEDPGVIESLWGDSTATITAGVEAGLLVGGGWGVVTI